MPGTNDLADEQTSETRLFFVLGLGSLLLWPVLFLFNLLILIQVMEHFVPPGAVPVVLPLVGWEMDPMALVFGVILSACQAIFVLFLDVARGWTKVVAGFLIMMGILFQVSGAFVYVKMSGEGMAGGGILTDQTTAGVVVLIGAMSPLSVMLTTSLAIRHVVAPILTLPGSLSQRVKLLNSHRGAATAPNAPR
jgi:hypothetical protein